MHKGALITGRMINIIGFKPSNSVEIFPVELLMISYMEDNK